MTDRGLVLDGLVVHAHGSPVLGAVSLSVPPGGALAIVGDAGSGKSTVLATLAGRRRPERGTILLNGIALDASRVGFADQQHRLPAGMTAGEHLVVPLLARGHRPDTWSGIESLLSRLGLPPSAHHNLLEELSGGQQQRVAVARALVGAPPLVCLDDPVSELDAANADLVRAAIADARRAGAVIVVAAPEPAAAAPFDRVLVLG